MRGLAWSVCVRPVILQPPHRTALHGGRGGLAGALNCTHPAPTTLATFAIRLVTIVDADSDPELIARRQTILTEQLSRHLDLP